MRKEKLAILGGSRGLGAALVNNLKTRGHDVFTVSRKNSSASNSPGESIGDSVGWFCSDFSQKNQWPQLIQKLDEFQPEVLIYCAGGGPYGIFGEKSWRDQEWSLAVTFECPAFLAWQWCHAQTLKSVQKLIVIGSSVAESQPDPKAAMYCAAKHALKGLLESLKLEYPQKEIHLFSAPYMDTDLLPPGAWPRQKPGLVHSPVAVAQDLVNSLLDGAPR